MKKLFSFVLLFFSVVFNLKSQDLFKSVSDDMCHCMSNSSEENPTKKYESCYKEVGEAYRKRASCYYDTDEKMAVRLLQTELLFEIPDYCKEAAELLGNELKTDISNYPKLLPRDCRQFAEGTFTYFNFITEDTVTAIFTHDSYTEKYPDATANYTLSWDGCHATMTFTGGSGEALSSSLEPGATFLFIFKRGGEDLLASEQLVKGYGYLPVFFHRKN